MNRPGPFSHFLFGALKLQLRGEYIHRVLTALHQSGVNLHHVQMQSASCVLTIALRDYATCYRVCRENHVRMRFLDRIGCPFLLQRARRRKFFVAGFLLFFIVVYVLSSMIWRIQVTATDEDALTGIRQAAKESGLYVGAWRHSLPDLLLLQKQILEKVPGIVWVGINVEGSVAHIEAVPKIPGVETSIERPHSIGASKPGVILRVFATRGQVVVKSGQVVQPGETLISGDLAAGIKQVPAAGQVFAEVWYTSKVQIPLQVSQGGLTGLSFNKEYLKIGGWPIRVWGFKQPSYTASIDRSEQTDWHIGRFLIPVQLETVHTFEVSEASESRSLADAKQEALALAVQDVRPQMGEGGRVLGQTVLQAQVSHGKLYETVLTRTEENIGVPIPIPQKPDSTENESSR